MLNLAKVLIGLIFFWSAELFQLPAKQLSLFICPGLSLLPLCSPLSEQPDSLQKKD
jgi:hypothetical protein